MLDISNHSLPAPQGEALVASLALQSLISAEIDAQQGWISFERFMQLALYAPGLGYYAGGAHKFGASGDFTTAPEMTPLFGQALATQVSEVLQRESFNAVLEFGAGTGKLAAHVLQALRAQGLTPAYFILDISADLRERQASTLAQLAPQCASQVQWLTRLPAAFEGVVIANEVLDAMPVQLLVKTAHGWAERGVSVHNSELQFADKPSQLSPPVQWASELPEGYCIELHTQAHAFMRTLPTWLKRGLALFIDYGFPEHEYYHPERSSGTVIAHYQHHTNPQVLQWPGLQDITSHVNFSAAALSSQDAGMDVLGYTSQARFLLNCGVLDALKNVSEATRLRETSAVQKLLAEHEMGELFKVLAVAQDIQMPLKGFSQGDRLHAL
jgi:SAM-dependent MidA family methyltransferase